MRLPVTVVIGKSSKPTTQRRAKKEYDMELNEYLKNKKWTEYLSALKPGRQYVAVLESYRDMDSLRSVAWRINARGENGVRFSIQTDYPQTSLIISVTETSKDE